ncbi:MAG: hypothetical protein G8237_04925 [Magnetococcales bacterium]|nr:hypothetical protein [Magnetococcales bacterium]NGZ05679.1 hypothetical protein [Magnetococcales bacterium]
MTDLLAAEPLILDRLRDRVALARQVHGARTFKAIPARTGAMPALYLIADGFQPLMRAGCEQAVEQVWLVVVAVRNLHDAEGGQGERREAGPLLFQVCQALIGWQPVPELGAMHLIASPGSVFSDEQALFSLRFAMRFVLCGV